MGNVRAEKTTRAENIEPPSIHWLLAATDSQSEIIGETTISSAGGDLHMEVHEYDGFRWLADQHRKSVHSLVSIERPDLILLENQRSMLVALLFSPNPEKILNLGFGCGGFERFFWEHLPNANLRSVELQPQMVELARKHFFVRGSHPIHIESAENFLKILNEKQDLIVCDTFMGNEHAEAVFHKEFYETLASSLTLNGLCSINLLPDSEKQLTNILLAARTWFSKVALIQHAETGNITLLLSQTVDYLIDPENLDVQERIGSIRENCQLDLMSTYKQLKPLPDRV